MDDPEQTSGVPGPRSPESGAFSSMIDDAVAPVDAQLLDPHPEPDEQAAPSGGFDRWTFLAAWVLIGLGLILVLWALIGNS